jgi:hypothetical protein
MREFGFGGGIWIRRGKWTAIPEKETKTNVIPNYNVLTESPLLPSLIFPNSQFIFTRQKYALTEEINPPKWRG